MKKTFTESTAILIVAVAAALIFNLVSGNPISIVKKYKKAEPVNKDYNIEKIDIDILQYYLNREDTILLDARPRSDFDKGHIPGATSFSIQEFDSLFRERGALLKLGNTILVYCSGPDCGDAEALAVELMDRGIRDIFVFPGGMEEWESRGHEIAQREKLK